MYVHMYTHTYSARLHSHVKLNSATNSPNTALSLSSEIGPSHVMASLHMSKNIAYTLP